jgi:phage gpG-like protein
MAFKALMEMRGTREMNQRLHALSKKIRRPERMYRRIVIEVEKFALQNIRADGKKLRPGGWPPFKPFLYKGRMVRGRMMKVGRARKKYPKWRWKVDENAKLLRDTGRLRSSIRRYYTPQQGKVFTRLDYAIAHHTGAGRLPKRQIIPRPWQVRKVAVRIATRYVKEEIARIEKIGKKV